MIHGQGEKVGTIVQPRSSIRSLEILSAPLTIQRGHKFETDQVQFAPGYPAIGEVVFPDKRKLTIDQSKALEDLLPGLLNDLKSNRS
jgi:hypothetical protein